MHLPFPPSKAAQVMSTTTNTAWGIRWHYRSIGTRFIPRIAPSSLSGPSTCPPFALSTPAIYSFNSLGSSSPQGLCTYWSSCMTRSSSRSFSHKLILSQYSVISSNFPSSRRPSWITCLMHYMHSTFSHYSVLFSIIFIIIWFFFCLCVD